MVVAMMLGVGVGGDGSDGSLGCCAVLSVERVVSGHTASLCSV